MTVQRLDKAQDSNKEALAALDKAMFNFCICLIKQRLSK